MLYEFLGQYRKEIIQILRKKILADSTLKPTSTLLDQGLPIFYDELIGVLWRTATATVSHADEKTFLSENKIAKGGAAAHGKELLRLGYTISQVVYSYGAVCQSITEFVKKKSYTITTQEFQDLNLSLDCAIAEAVTEFENIKIENINNTGTERLGFLIHEIGSSLSAASIAHKMIQEGRVGSAGSTSKALSGSIEHMWHLISSAQMEIRMRTNASPSLAQVRLKDITNEIETTAIIKAGLNGVRLQFDIDPAIQLTADRYLLSSALSNLVGNALKFTKNNACTTVRSKESNGRILIKIEDECGGLPDGKIEELFKPFIQNGNDRSGMGLGLSISRRAIELNKGRLIARNIPGKGCVFTISLPKDKEPPPA